MTLRVEKLTIAYGPATSIAVRDVGLDVAAGEVLGLIGESGCGKSTLALGILGLLPSSARVVSGTVEVEGRSILDLPRDSLRRLRWRDLAYVPQGAMNALDPVRNLYSQFAATARAHGWREDIRARAEALLAQVGLDRSWLDRFPHELSGGMRQRVTIALALFFEPRLIVADEPTTGLDVIVQHEVLEVLRRLRVERRLSLLLISHDLGVVAQHCHRVAVMYAGRIVEAGPAAEVLQAPRHPYTMAMRLAFAELDNVGRPGVSIGGFLPGLDATTVGCAFAPRCPFAIARCRQEEPAPRTSDEHFAACHRAHEANTLRPKAADPTIWESD